MRKILFWLPFSFIFILFLAACGEKSEEKVIEKLAENIEALDSYYAEAEMTMDIGQEEQKFDIEIRYQKEDFYRVDLKNNHSEHGEQIIVKNEQGVFVLTPELDKKFKFQTEWPHHSSQPYLYQSIVQDIIEDEELSFEMTDDYYLFVTKTNYQNNDNLPLQKVAIDKKSFLPRQVQVMDIDQNILVEVDFQTFETDQMFTEDEFDADFILENASAEALKSQEPDEINEGEGESFPILFPLFTAGSELSTKKTVEMEEGERVIMTFSGDKNFTLVQEKTEHLSTMNHPKIIKGELVNLGFTVGALSETSVEWNYQGVDFYLASDSLTQEELIQVAQSVQGREAK